MSSTMRQCLCGVRRLRSRTQHKACHRVARARATSREPEHFMGWILRRRATQKWSGAAPEEDIPERQNVRSPDTLSWTLCQSARLSERVAYGLPEGEGT